MAMIGASLERRQPCGDPLTPRMAVIGKDFGIDVEKSGLTTKAPDRSGQLSDVSAST
jgi:hypothetical protein